VPALERRAFLADRVDAAVEQVARALGADHPRGDDQVVQRRVHHVVERLVVLGARPHPSLRVAGDRRQHAQRGQELEDIGEAAAVLQALQVQLDPVLGRERAHLLRQQADRRLRPRALARRQSEREQHVVAAGERLPRVGMPGARDASGTVGAQLVRALAQAGVGRSHDQLVAQLALELRPQPLRMRAHGAERGVAGQQQRAGEERTARVAQAVLELLGVHRAHALTCARPTWISRSGLSSTPPSPSRTAATGRSSPMSSTVSCSVPSSE
jgi:hypothetical protein